MKSFPTSTLRQRFSPYVFCALVLALVALSFRSASGQEAMALAANADSAIKTEALIRPTAESVTPVRISEISVMPYFAKSADYKDLTDYMHKSVRYPEAEMMRGERGAVTVGFEVLPSGKIANVYPISAPNAAFAEEAVRVVSEMPNWEPAFQGNRPVRSAHRLKIDFKMR